MKLRLVSLFAITLGAAACAPMTSPQVQVGREFDVALGRDAKVQGTPITVLFRGVTNDSRCAVDVQCVWAGNAALSVSIFEGNGPPTDATLNTGVEPRSIAVGGHTVRLVGLKPAPHSGKTIAPQDYVATFEVE
jgi:hypothetical protein